MREKLAVARAHSRMDVCASAAFADPLGLALLRAIDNSDGASLRQSQALLLAKLRRRSYMARGKAISIVRAVLLHLHDQRCPACAGNRFTAEGGGLRACTACNSTGLTDYPARWGNDHRSVLADCMGAMGRALHQARRGFD